MIITYIREHNQHNEVKKALWGTCLGFEEVMIVESGNKLELAEVDNYHRFEHLMPVNRGSRLMQYFSEEELQVMESQDVFLFNDKYAITKESIELYENQMIKSVPVAYAKTLGKTTSKEILAIAEDSEQPFFAVQFHPEKVLFERPFSEQAPDVAKELMKKFGAFFIDQVPAHGEEADVDRLIGNVKEAKVLDDIGPFEQIIVIGERRMFI